MEHDDVVQVFRDGIRRFAEGLSGRPLPAGTSVVGDVDRSGSSTAVAYPLGPHTVVFCDPSIESRLSDLNGERALTVDEYADRASLLGGEVVGRGNNRVLNGPIAISAGDLSALVLDPEASRDLRRLETFIAACDPDDLDEAELDLAELDRHIVVLVDGDGAIAAYASGRVWTMGERFDDIGVIVRPARRRAGLGARVVAAYVEHRRGSGARFLYRNDVDNVASGRLAASLGFELVHTIAAVRFESPT